jgi:rhodanese-related sulfurtransferase
VALFPRLLPGAVHCHSGGRTTANAQLLTSKDFRDAYQLRGGIVAWKAAGLPTRLQPEPTGVGRRKLFGLF